MRKVVVRFVTTYEACSFVRRVAAAYCVLDISHAANSRCTQTQLRWQHSDAGPKVPGPLATAPSPQERWIAASQNSEWWMCPKCRKINTARRDACGFCSVHRPHVFRWCCTECGSTNNPGLRFCRNCASPAPPMPLCWRCPCCALTVQLTGAQASTKCTKCNYEAVPNENTVAEAPPPGVELVSEAAAPARRGGRHNLIDAAAPAQPPSEITEAPGFEWMCRSCGTVCSAEEFRCSACQKALAPGPWKCVKCGTGNHWSRKVCFNCDTPIPTGWECPACQTRTSIYDDHCRNCHARQPEIASRPARQGQRKDWICPSCGKQNFANRDECFICGLRRSDYEKPDADGSEGTSAAASARGAAPVGAAKPSPIQYIQPVGDNNWMCIGCHATNFRTRVSCWQCGRASSGAAAAAAATAPSTEDVKPTIEKEGFQQGHDNDVAPGLKRTWLNASKQSDWLCSKCFAHNFRTRPTCHKCGGTRASQATPRSPRRSFPKL